MVEDLRHADVMPQPRLLGDVFEEEDERELLPPVALNQRAEPHKITPHPRRNRGRRSAAIPAAASPVQSPPDRDQSSARLADAQVAQVHVLQNRILAAPAKDGRFAHHGGGFESAEVSQHRWSPGRISSASILGISLGSQPSKITRSGWAKRPSSPIGGEYWRNHRGRRWPLRSTPPAPPP